MCDQSALEHQDSDLLASDECSVKIFNGIEQRPIFSTIMEPVHVQIQVMIIPIDNLFLVLLVVVQLDTFDGLNN